MYYGYSVVSDVTMALDGNRLTSIPVICKFPEESNPSYSCPACGSENKLLYYDGMIQNKTLDDKVAGVPGIMSSDSHSFVSVQPILDCRPKISKGEILGKVYTLVDLEGPPYCMVLEGEELASSLSKPFLLLWT